MSVLPVKIFQKALFEAGTPSTAFAVDNIAKEYERVKKPGVTFPTKPTKMGSVTVI